MPGFWVPPTSQSFSLGPAGLSCLRVSDSGGTHLPGATLGRGCWAERLQGRRGRWRPGFAEEASRVLGQEDASNCCVCAFPEIQSRRQERKRRSTANPAYSGLLETEVGTRRLHTREWGGSPGLASPTCPSRD